nr:hypothetical protein CFP56_28980 [Quercus suber]
MFGIPWPHRCCRVHNLSHSHSVQSRRGPWSDREKRVFTQANNQTHPSHDLVAGGYELKIQGTVDRLIILLLYIIIAICSGGITLPFCRS